ncbi:Hypothetical predicted protein [Pelobates cultripes]|uniref:Torsin-1A-interacting protein 1/2 AAA+ activator domain-containing protein n=1 Tax=Pelobates cultripes TaxID=61616 RepID=A0AAD1ST81_PELCU|nr:Hypothetical predicted protein [Pelobates cultripes]
MEGKPSENAGPAGDAKEKSSNNRESVVDTEKKVSEKTKQDDVPQDLYVEKSSSVSENNDKKESALDMEQSASKTVEYPSETSAENTEEISHTGSSVEPEADRSLENKRKPSTTDIDEKPGEHPELVVDMKENAGPAGDAKENTSDNRESVADTEKRVGEKTTQDDVPQENNDKGSALDMEQSASKSVEYPSETSAENTEEISHTGSSVEPEADRSLENKRKPSTTDIDEKPGEHPELVVDMKENAGPAGDAKENTSDNRESVADTEKRVGEKTTKDDVPQENNDKGSALDMEQSASKSVDYPSETSAKNTEEISHTGSSVDPEADRSLENKRKPSATDIDEKPGEHPELVVDMKENAGPAGDAKENTSDNRESVADTEKRVGEKTTQDDVPQDLSVENSSLSSANNDKGSALDMEQSASETSAENTEEISHTGSSVDPEENRSLADPGEFALATTEQSLVRNKNAIKKTESTLNKGEDFNEGKVPTNVTENNSSRTIRSCLDSEKIPFETLELAKSANTVLYQHSKESNLHDSNLFLTSEDTQKYVEKSPSIESEESYESKQVERSHGANLEDEDSKQLRARYRPQFIQKTSSMTPKTSPGSLLALDSQEDETQIKTSKAEYLEKKQDSDPYLTVWQKKQKALVGGFLCVVGVGILFLYFLSGSSPSADPNPSVLQIYQREFESFKTYFPGQNEALWLRSQKMHLKHLNKSNPLEPTTLILTAARGGERTLRCLSEQLAKTYSSALNASYLAIDGSTKAKYDSKTAKLHIDQKLDSGFKTTYRAAVLHRLEELPAGSLLILYKYCDHENAAFTNVALVLTVLLDKETLDRNLSLAEIEEKVKDFLWKRFTSPNHIGSHNEMDVDKLSGVWSRISHLVLPVLPVDSIESGNCPWPLEGQEETD